MDKLEKELTMEMIPEGTYKEIAGEIGTENLIKVARIIGGQKFYFVKADKLLQPVRNLHIKKEFNGYNHVELANRYNLSVNQIRNICGRGKLKRKPAENDPNQLRFYQ